jgi:phosphoglucosamine mutase
MTADFALRLGAAAGRYFRRDGSVAHRVVIGKDTRLSGYMFENALTAGFTSTGMNVLLLGPVPTPAVGLLTRSMRADVGVMISASHNPHEDNGIKFFGPDGFKLSDEAEERSRRSSRARSPRRGGPTSGARSASTTGASATTSGSRRPSPRLTLDGLKVVVDCANGAAYRAAPEVLWELGAEVVPLGVAPNGRNINDGCGSTAPELAARTVRETGADVGICLDGDADRVIVIDETGRWRTATSSWRFWPRDGPRRGGFATARWWPPSCRTSGSSGSSAAGA